MNVIKGFLPWKGSSRTEDRPNANKLLPLRLGVSSLVNKRRSQAIGSPQMERRDRTEVSNSWGRGTDGGYVNRRNYATRRA